MESSLVPALLMSAMPEAVRFATIAFLIPLAQVALFKALLKSGVQTQLSSIK